MTVYLLFLDLPKTTATAMQADCGWDLRRLFDAVVVFCKPHNRVMFEKRLRFLLLAYCDSRPPSDFVAMSSRGCFQDANSWRASLQGWMRRCTPTLCSINADEKL